ncbi:MAG: DUF4252 domain-containing protein [Gammaproteobacteria bacterium]|nr:DUF4252 domain-containing protein [Gammaproteobacteria bacterium]MDP7455788.1 DUF4252 domain-containing protein [Gammaproteobacteria bacterium]HJO12009.1 DUF4252 domain-containing protein [Gammaproteobacteria bacterium]
MKLLKILIAPLALLVLAQAMYAAEDNNIQDHPGYVDFTGLSGVSSAEPNVEVTLKAPVLSLLTNLISNEDEEAAEFISKLLRVTVNVFASDSIDIDEVANSMATIADELDADGWERIVRIREDEDHVDVYFRLSDNAEVIYGIAIMVAEPGETVLVNIVGDISVNDISALGRRFNIDELVDLDIDAN